MTPADLVAAAESKVRHAENNLATCANSLIEAKRIHGGVPNTEVMMLAQGQAMLSQAYSSLAMAKATTAMLEAVPPAPDAGGAA